MTVVMSGRVRHRWRPLARIGLVGLGFTVGFVLVYYVTVRTLRGRLFGDASLRGAMLTRSALAGVTDSILDVVSVGLLLGAVAVVATIALVRLSRVEGLAAVGLLVGANASAFVLKRHLLERPDLGIREVAPATLNSLPSGHVTAVFSAIAALLLVVPIRLRAPTALAGLVAATATALATMSAGWHRAGDSMAAFLLVGAWTALAAAVVLLAQTSDEAQRELFQWPASTRWLAALSAGTLTLAITLGAALDAAAPVRDTTLGSSVAFLVGGLLIIGTGIGVLLGMLDVLAVMATPDRLDDDGVATTTY